MKLKSNTILITGGASGIGYELTKQLTALGNKILITGRDQAKMDRTKAACPKIHTFQSDVSDPQAIATLYEKVTQQFPELNILINNAGIMRKINVHDKAGSLEDITREIEVNLIGPIRMVKQFLPHLKTKSQAAIMNVSSGLAFVPLPISPTTISSRGGKKMWWCAGMNRHGVEDERASRERSSDPLGPEFCTGRCEVSSEA